MIAAEVSDAHQSALAAEAPERGELELNAILGFLSGSRADFDLVRQRFGFDMMLNKPRLVEERREMVMALLATVDEALRWSKVGVDAASVFPMAV